MDIHQLRKALPITRDWVYMNTGWAGPSPEPVLQRIRETLAQEALAGPASREGLALARGVREETRTAIAGLVNTAPEDIAITHSTTEGVYVVLYGIDWKPGDELLICDLEHPALTRPAQVLAQRYGVRTVEPAISPQAGGGEALEAITSALSPKTRLMALSHIQFTCGLRMPIREIAQAVHEHGVPLLVDGAQSVGHIQVDMQELECDFYAFSGQKWLMGPVGTGALYVRHDRRAMLEPLFTTNALADEREGGRSPLGRFAVASESPGLVAGFGQAARMAAETGIDAIERHIMHLSTLLRDQASDVPGCTLLGPREPDTACGLVTVHMAGWEPEELVSALQDQFRIVARAVHHPDGVRFSTAYFNTEDEVEQVATALAELAEAKDSH